MKRIPIYDATEPIVCTIDVEEVQARLELIERMRLDLDHIDRTEHGLLLTFPRREDVERAVRGFAADEKRCCRFWGFAVEATVDVLRLRWEGPPATDELLDRLLAYFEGDEPIGAIEGIL